MTRELESEFLPVITKVIDRQTGLERGWHVYLVRSGNSHGCRIYIAGDSFDGVPLEQAKSALADLIKQLRIAEIYLENGDVWNS